MIDFVTSSDGGKKILIADDDQDILESMRMMLEMEGYQVETTVNGERVNKMSKEQPDLLLLDIRMSGIDGRDVCRSVKADKTTRDIPIIMISANEDAAKSVKASGADDFIAKPFEMHDFLHKVEKYLAKN